MKNASLRRWAHKANGGVPIAMDIGAAVLLSEGANLMYAPAGWITAGLALIVINWRIYGDQ